MFALELPGSIRLVTWSEAVRLLTERAGFGSQERSEAAQEARHRIREALMFLMYQSPSAHADGRHQSNKCAALPCVQEVQGVRCTIADNAAALQPAAGHVMRDDAEGHEEKAVPPRRAAAAVVAAA